MNDFSSLELHDALKRAIAAQGYQTPTPIQAQAIPSLIAGRDLLGQSQTGTGKTAAFGLPLLQKLLTTQRGGRRMARALVLTPTRELAQQVHEQLTAFARHTQLRGTLIVGGLSIMKQEHEIRQGPDWIVATPGRLVDHLGRGDYLSLGGVQYFVLDEADRMLDMGFLKEVRAIVAALPEEKRQTALFSATLPKEMQALAKQILDRPIRVDIGGATTSAPLVTEELWPVAQDQKFDLLIALLERGMLGKALIFTRTKVRADRLVKRLKRAGKEAMAMHGDRSQADRMKALKRFKSEEENVLVATDVAARGIDVTGIPHVVNFDVPVAPEDYIHRVGRTGRAGREGVAWTLASLGEMTLVAAIERTIGKRLPSRRLDDFEYLEEVAEEVIAKKTMPRKAAALTEREGSSKRHKSPFTKDGRVRAGFELPEDKQKRRPRKVKMRKRLPHEK